MFKSYEARKKEWDSKYKLVIWIWFFTVLTIALNSVVAILYSKSTASFTSSLPTYAYWLSGFALSLPILFIKPHPNTPLNNPFLKADENKLHYIWIIPFMTALLTLLTAPTLNLIGAPATKTTGKNFTSIVIVTSKFKRSGKGLSKITGNESHILVVKDPLRNASYYLRPSLSFWEKVKVGSQLEVIGKESTFGSSIHEYYLVKQQEKPPFKFERIL